MCDACLCHCQLNDLDLDRGFLTFCFASKRFKYDLCGCDCECDGTPARLNDLDLDRRFLFCIKYFASVKALGTTVNTPEDLGSQLVKFKKVFSNLPLCSSGARKAYM